MKKVFLLFITFFAITTSFAAMVNTPIEVNEKNKLKFNQLKLENPRTSCTVTRSVTKTATGKDCWGEPITISVTESCSNTAEDCATANANAYICASLLASNGLDIAVSVIIGNC